MTKEQKFYKALQDVFIGAKIEGKGGFINLMRIKSNYYRKIENILKKDIEAALKSHPKFRDELFDKLYSFFSRYFTESGSIYFNSTPFHNNIYEKVYTDEKDVILFWKTQMLYYVKTDRIFRSLPVEFDGFKFYFDASKIESKKANEKRSLIFELSKVREDETIVFGVTYSERGAKTKQDEILKAIKRKGIAITEEQLERAFRVFEKQSEVDFFINKNAKAFLQEQFKLWSYQYFWEGAKEWGADRVNQLQILKDIAFKIINFISQFEDELVKIWNKPKFVKNSNYVITLDRIGDKKLVEKIKKHKNFSEQVKEWKELGIDKDNPKAPIDTKYFKDLEIEILALFDDLDNSLDGWLIKSENYQALNTILPKFKEKVQTIYIDPPFNSPHTEIIYPNNYKHSSWLSLMGNRIQLAKYFLKKDGVFECAIDEKEQESLGKLLEDIFPNYDKTCVSIVHNPRGIQGDNFSYTHEYTYFLAPSKGIIKKVEISKEEYEYSQLRKWGGESERHTAKNCFYPIIIKKGKIIGAGKVCKDDEHPKKIVKKKSEIWVYPIDSDGVERKWRYARESFDQIKNYLIIDGEIDRDFDIKIPQIFASFKTVWVDSKYDAGTYGKKILNNIVPNNNFDYPKSIYNVQDCLLAGTNQDALILDFFAGSGTTAHAILNLNLNNKRSNRKYILIELGDHFHTVILPRIKKLCTSNKWENGKPKNNIGISQFFKYYELEQYEEALANCKYEESDLFSSPSKTPYQEYVFMKDEKMLSALEIDYEKNKVKVDLTKLYPSIDIAETLSNLTGKWIKKVSDTEVEFEDGTKINTKDLDYKLIKPLIWW